MTKIAAIIPARMASTRFPGKPLLKIEGLPMIEHVRRRALLCQDFSDVVVATCDQEIADCIGTFKGRVVMTSPNHQVATERVIEAMTKLDCTHLVNVQGDEILVLPQDLERMTGAIRKNPQGKMWNAIAPLETKEELADPSIVKCVVSPSDQILFCARHASSLNSVYWVIGILGYSRSFLQSFSSLPKTLLEQETSIEQMRAIENDIPIQAVRFAKAYPGINEPREAAVVQQLLKEDPKQKKILAKIL